MQRCPWATSELYIRYHDAEWGVAVHDDRLLFEFLLLEGAQAGLSWETILKKRENYREAFDQFNPTIVAKYDSKKLQELLAFAGIVRNRLKIASAITNAKAFMLMQEEFGTFDQYIWRFVEHQGAVPSCHEIRGKRSDSRTVYPCGSLTRSAVA